MIMIYRKYIKRLLDILISFVSVIILSPVYLILALLVRTKLGSPVLFHQDRPGLNGKIFHMYKFRSMKVQSEKASQTTWTTKVDPRKTKWGEFMRK